MAGGAPVTQDFIEKISGDADGASATGKAKELINRSEVYRFAQPKYK